MMDRSNKGGSINDGSINDGSIKEDNEETSSVILTSELTLAPSLLSISELTTLSHSSSISEEKILSIWTFFDPS